MSRTHDFWTDRLSSLLDGELPPREASALEEHLGECGACREVRDELVEIRRRARALPALEPERDLWAGIESRLGEDPLAEKVIPLSATAADPSAGRGVRGVRFTLPQAVAAAVVLLAGGWMGGVLAAPGDAGRGAGEMEGGTLPVQALPAVSGALPGGLSQEVATLERTLRDRAATLDEETRLTLLRSLDVIDRAIGESLDALSRDPGSEYLQGHLGSALERKRGYLRQMLTLLEA